MKHDTRSLAKQMARRLRSKNPPLSLYDISRIVGYDPNVLTVNGYELLRLACSLGSDDDIVMYMIEQCPEGVRVAWPTSGSLPLHCVCSNKDLSLRVIRKLVQIYPESVRMGDKHNNLPLHEACFSDRRSDLVATIQFLFDQYPNAVHTRNTLGQLPVHFAVKMDVRERKDTSATRKAVQLLLDAYPRSVHGPGKGDNLWKSRTVIKYVMSQYPHLAKVKREGEFPLHFICTQRKATVPIVESVVKAFPTALFMPSKQGYTPLEKMRRRDVYGRSLSVQKYLEESMKEILREACRDVIDSQQFRIPEDVLEHILTFVTGDSSPLPPAVVVCGDADEDDALSCTSNLT